MTTTYSIVERGKSGKLRRNIVDIAIANGDTLPLTVSAANAGMPNSVSYVDPIGAGAVTATPSALVALWDKANSLLRFFQSTNSAAPLPHVTSAPADLTIRVAVFGK